MKTWSGTSQSSRWQTWNDPDERGSVRPRAQRGGFQEAFGVGKGPAALGLCVLIGCDQIYIQLEKVRSPSSNTQGVVGGMHVFSYLQGFQQYAPPSVILYMFILAFCGGKRRKVGVTTRNFPTLLKIGAKN